MSKRIKVASLLVLVSFILMICPFTFGTKVEAATNPRGSSVGVLRWDAWMQDHVSEPGTVPYLGLQVSRNMSTNQYHSRIPFYATENAYNNVTINGLSQTVMDQEIAYAKNAKIDYWIYCTYADGSGGDGALALHLSSSYKNDVKFAVISNLDDSRNIDWFKQSNYMKVSGGRPIFFMFYGDPGVSYSKGADAATAFRNKCIDAGAGNPYIVLLNSTSGNYGADDVNGIGADAISGYSYMTTPTDWNNWANSGVKVIPNIRTGMDRTPRINNKANFLAESDFNPSAWTIPISSFSQITSDLNGAFTWNNDNQTAAEANSVVIYSWNEFDEGGGCLCPSLYTGADYLNAVASATGGTQQTTHGNPTPLPTPSDSFAGIWKFDSNLKNSVAEDDLAVSNGAAYNTGVSGNALKLDGSNYAECVDSKQVGDLINMTVSAWVKLDQLPMQAYTVVEKADSAYGGSYRLAIDKSGTAQFVVSTANNSWYSSGTYATSTTVLRSGIWYHLTGHYDGSHVRIFVNGANDGTGSQTISGSITKSYTRLLIGGKQFQGVDLYQGLIDDLRIYRRALSSTEVQSLYNYYGYTPPTPGSVVYFPNPVSYWGFENNCNDSQGSNNGTAYGGTSYSISQKGQGIDLNGSSGYVNVPDATNLKGMSNLTVSTWIKMDQLPSQNYDIIEKGNTYRFIVDSTGMAHFVVATTNNSWYSSGTVATAATILKPNAWYNLVGVYDGSRVKIYIDGIYEAQGSQNISGNVLSSTTTLQFGNTGTNINYFDGMLDEARVYDKALNDGQVSMVYKSCKGQFANGPKFNGCDMWSPTYTLNYNAFGSISSLLGYAGATTSSNGVIGKCLSLNGSYQCLQDMKSFFPIDAKDVTNPTLSTFSFGAWVKLNQLPSSGKSYVLMEKEGNFRIAIGSDGRGHATVATTNNSWYSTGTVASFTTALTTSKWYYIFGTYDGANVRVYVNGKKEGTGSSSISGNVLYNKTTLGGYGTVPDANIQYINGYIDEASVFRRGLSDAEVYELYSSYMDAYSK